MLKAAVIGCGAMGKSHARVYSDISSRYGLVKLVAVVDKEINSARMLADKFNLRSYSSHEEMFKNEKPDLVSVVTPTKTHAEIALYFIKNKVNVLVEKPIADNSKSALRIIQAAKKAGIKLMVGHIERFNPAIVELKKRLSNGEIGKIYKVDITRAGPFPPRINDVGVVMDLAVHDIDMLRFLLNSEPERIYAETERKIHSIKEDLLAAIISFKNGVVSYLNTNWLTPTKIRKLFIVGEKGMFVADFLLQDIYFYKNKDIKSVSEYTYIVNSVSEGDMTKFSIAKKEPLMAEIEHFIDSVLKNKEPNVSGKDGLRAVEIAEKLLLSAKTKNLVVL